MSTGPARTAFDERNEAEIIPIEFSVENRCPVCRCIWSQGKIAAGARLVVRCPRPRCGAYFRIEPDESMPRVVTSFEVARLRDTLPLHTCITCRAPFARGAFGSGSALFIVCRTCRTENRLLIV